MSNFETAFADAWRKAKEDAARQAKFNDAVRENGLANRDYWRNCPSDVAIIDTASFRVNAGGAVHDLIDLQCDLNLPLLTDKKLVCQ